MQKVEYVTEEFEAAFPYLTSHEVFDGTSTGKFSLTMKFDEGSEGHKQLKAAIDAGLSMYTHLGNGCPLNLHRHDNIVQRVLSVSDDLAIGFIADGIHVPFVALGNYLKVTGLRRAFVVTDAISAAVRSDTAPCDSRASRDTESRLNFASLS